MFAKIACPLFKRSSIDGVTRTVRRDDRSTNTKTVNEPDPAAAMDQDRIFRGRYQDDNFLPTDEK